MQQTTDIWYVAFLLYEKNFIMKEIKRGKKVFFVFDIEDGNWNKMKIEFSNSQYSKMKWNLERVKDMIF